MPYNIHGYTQMLWAWRNSLMVFCLGNGLRSCVLDPHQMALNVDSFSIFTIREPWSMWMNGWLAINLMSGNQNYYPPSNEQFAPEMVGWRINFFLGNRISGVSWKMYGMVTHLPGAQAMSGFCGCLPGGQGLPSASLGCVCFFFGFWMWSF